MNQKNSILKSAFLVTAMMLAFKIIGFIKQAVIAYFFGATLETDTYFIAYGFVAGISEAIVKSLLVSIVAVYTNLRIRAGKETAEKLINGLVELLVPLFLLIALFVTSSAPLFSKILAPSYSSTLQSTLSKYIMILAPVFIFSSLELIFGAVLDSHKSFFIPRLQSFIYSVSTITVCIVFSKVFGIKTGKKPRYEKVDQKRRRSICRCKREIYFCRRRRTKVRFRKRISGFQP